MINDVDGLIFDFVQVANLAGFSISESEIEHINLDAPHSPPSLPNGKQAVYTFSLSSSPEIVLKVGKAGPNTKARYRYQHYNPRSAGSTLAASILNNQSDWQILGIKDLSENNINDWLKTNTDRNDFLISSDHNSLLLSLFEIFMQCRLKPIFEG
ncbi:MAG: hypothetical protein H8D34_05190 [Chloroflexi bacterium]|nr:hypothetical protein [Chloroflexota bacterium]